MPNNVKNLAQVILSNKHSNMIEIAIISAIAISSYVLGAFIFNRYIDTAQFYQQYFYLPLHYACTGEFSSFEFNQAAQDFFLSPRATFTDCAKLAETPTKPWNGFDGGAIFLLALSGLLWRFLGIAWTNLAPIAGLLTAILAVSAYLLFRVFCKSSLIATAAAVAFTLHTSVSTQAPHLRDFSKAPFIVAALALIAAAVFKQFRLPGIAALATSAGAMVAIGQGFRPDIIAILPIAIMAPLFALGSEGWKTWAGRATSLWLGFAFGYIAIRALTLAATPPLSTSGTFIGHVFLLGFAENFTSGVQGMAEASYRVFTPYVDILLFGFVNLFKGRTFAQPDLWASIAYDKETIDLLASTYLTVPNDAFMRIFYTANKLPSWVPLVWGAPLIVATWLLWISRRREYIFIAFCFALFAAISSLQLDRRHVFFLGIFGFCLGCLFLDAALSDLRSKVSHRATRQQGSLSLLFTLIGVIALIAITSIVTGLVQERRINNNLKAYAALSWQAIDYSDFKSTLLPEGTVQLGDALQIDLEKASTASTVSNGTQLFAKITLTPKTSEATCANLVLSQEYWYFGQDLSSHPWAVPEGTKVEFFFPMLYDPSVFFKGLKFRGDTSKCNIDWHIAESFPAGTLPLEIWAVDDEILAPYRGSWTTVLVEFLL